MTVSVNRRLRYCGVPAAASWQTPGVRNSICTGMSHPGPRCATKKPQRASRSAGRASKCWKYGVFGTIIGTMNRGGQRLRDGAVAHQGRLESKSMSSLPVKLGFVAAIGLMLSGCMQAATYEATNASAFKPRDKEYLSKIRYTN